MAILASVSFTVALGYGIVAPGIPRFARDFGVSTAAAASVISAFALMRIVGALPAGRLVDRLGEHVTMASGIGIVAASSILAGFSGSFAELIALRGIGGLGSAMFSVSAQTSTAACCSSRSASPPSSCATARFRTRLVRAAGRSGRWRRSAGRCATGPIVRRRRPTWRTASP